MGIVLLYVMHRFLVVPPTLRRLYSKLSRFFDRGNGSERDENKKLE